jgi:hypothetical protein
MLESIFKITALIETGEQGEHVFKVFEHEEPLNKRDFLMVMKETVYMQGVYRSIREGDSLLVTMHLDLARHEIEKNVRFNDDQLFEGDDLAEPTPDLLPMVDRMYEQFSRQMFPGDVLTITFHVRRD